MFRAVFAVLAAFTKLFPFLPARTHFAVFVATLVVPPENKSIPSPTTPLATDTGLPVANPQPISHTGPT